MKQRKLQEKVDFICIGAQKAATSWLYDRLNELPDFDLLEIKELHYFDRSKEYPSPNKFAISSPLRRMGNLSWVKTRILWLLYTLKSGNYQKIKRFWKWNFATYNDNWYLSLFNGKKGLRGDITPSYSILNPEDVERMYKLAPDAKIIFLLRNPIDRAWSHYRFHKDKFALGDDFSQMKVFFDSDNQHLRSDYLRALKIYSKFYSPENIMIGFYDTVKANPVELLKEISEFLGCNYNSGQISDFCAVSKKKNVSQNKIMPPEVYEYLKNKYEADITEMGGMLGSYAAKWEYDIKVNKKAEQIQDFHSTILLSDTLKQA